MTDLIQNVQEVYKKWESRGPNIGSRGRRRDLQNDSGGTFRSFGRSRHQFDNQITYDRPGERRFHQRTRTSHFKLPKYDGLAQFKMAPCVAVPSKQRPFVGACCPKCFPISRASISDKTVFYLSVCNVLHIPLLRSLNFNLVFNILKKNQCPLYPDVSLNVLQNERICEVVENVVLDCQRENVIEEESSAVLKAAQFSRAKDIFESLKTSISTTCLQISSFILQSVFSRIFDSILIHKGHIEILKAAGQGDIPLLYLPVHHNNLNYVLISFILYMSSLKVPVTAVDNNLYIPILGWFTRMLGAFYIRRYLECDRNKKDFVQSAVIQSYLTECLKAGHSVQFFIEDKPSIPSQPHIPRSELLSFVLQAVIEEKIDDIHISTVSVSYEKISEANFVFQQLGETKSKETLLAKLYRYWKILHFNLGSVRINFSQPFSLQEFLQRNKLKIPKKLVSLDTPPSSPSTRSLQDPHLSSLVNTLVHHVIYDATNSASLMSTHLVAFLFITQYRKGATQQQLQSSLDWLRGELANKKYDAGFTGESLPVIKRAVDLLGKDLISLETIEVEWTSSDLENNNIKVTMYKPVTQLPHILELQYYSNHAVPVFLLDSMIVNALYALVDVEICHFRHCDSKLYVVREKVIDKAIELSDILRFEFVAVPPCADIIFLFSDVLDELVEKECLHVVGAGNIPGRARYSNTPHALSFEGSEEEEDDCSIEKQQQLKIDLKEESINHFEFLRSVLSPYIESYWLAAITLLKLIDEIKEEKVLIHDMQITAQEKLCKGLLAYEESFSAVTFKNAVRLFEHWQIVEHYVQDEIKILYLNENYNCKERINDVIARIEEFRK